MAGSECGRPDRRREAIVASLADQLKPGDKSLVRNRGDCKVLDAEGAHFAIDEDKLQSAAQIDGAMERLERAKEILMQYGNYEWLTQYGGLVVSNNGIEWAATYFVMLLALFFLGGGRWVILDYWIARKFGSA